MAVLEIKPNIVKHRLHVWPEVHAVQLEVVVEEAVRGEHRGAGHLGQGGLVVQPEPGLAQLVPPV